MNSLRRYGIRAIDTSVYYGPSEIVLGEALHAIRDEFPRSSYKLVRTTFDYSIDVNLRHAESLPR